MNELGMVFNYLATAFIRVVMTSDDEHSLYFSKDGSSLSNGTFRVSIFQNLFALPHMPFGCCGYKQEENAKIKMLFKILACS